MHALTKYDAARYALSVAVEVDEVKDIRDKAEAMAAYARQAKDTELVQWATEIKVRAERRAGQMLAEMPKQDGGHAAKVKARSHDGTEVPKSLADIGITKNESSRWQKLAAVTDTQFEEAVASAKEVAGEVTTAAMLRAAKACEPPKPAPVAPAPAPAPAEVEPEIEAPPDYTELDAAHDQISELQSALVVARMGDIPEEEKQHASELIAELRAEVKTLDASLKAAYLSRDQLMEENAQMKRQMAMQRREIEKLKSNK